MAIVPQDLLAPFRVWSIKDIYTGIDVQGSRKFVPNVDDMVVDWTSGVFRVTHVDSSGLSTLQSVDLSELTQGLRGVPLETRVVPYRQMMRIFINSDVEPFTMNLDCQYLIYGQDTAYMKIFHGTDISIAGTVISRVYDTNGNIVSENVPLYPIDPTNPNIKFANGFNSSMALTDGDIATAVFYTSTGIENGQDGFIVKNSNAIRGLGQNQKVIDSISLVSNFLDTVSLNVINAPMNIPVSGFNFQARLTYSDGASQLIAVGTNKCQLFGLEDFNPSVAGVMSPLVLTYYLSNNESANLVRNPIVKQVSTDYSIRAVSNVLTHSFKVFVVPNFNTTNGAYTNDFYLFSLDRTVFHKLTTNQYTLITANGGPLNLTAGHTGQKFTIAVDIGSVLGSTYSGFIFPEVMTVTYGLPGGVGWILDYLNSSTFTFGANALVEFTLSNNGTFSVLSGSNSLVDWLQLMWQPIHAIFDSTTVIAPPTPTHMYFLYNGVQSPLLKISDYWNLLHQNYFGQTFTSNSTMSIIWMYLEPDNVTYGYLGISPLVMRNTLL